MTAPADVNTVVWTVALIVDVVLACAVAGRWAWLGRARATTRGLRVGLFVSTLTVVWVYPGIVAAIGVLLIASLRKVVPRYRRPVGSS